MEKPENHSSLPKVEQDDLLVVFVESGESENHIDQWYYFADTNHVIADEVLNLSYKEASDAVKNGENARQLQIRMLKIAGFTVRAMQVALERETRQREELTGVGDDDEGRQP